MKLIRFIEKPQIRYPVFLGFVLAVIAFLLSLFMRGSVAVAGTAKEEAASGTNRVELVTLITYEFQGRHYACVTPYSHLTKAPRWESERTEPPLSVKTALVIAGQYGHTFLPSDMKFTPRKIVLKCWLGDIWFYDIQLEPPPYLTGDFIQRAGPMAPFDVAVLMDGTVADREEQILDPTRRQYIPKPK